MSCKSNSCRTLSNTRVQLLVAAGPQSWPAQCWIPVPLAGSIVAAGLHLATVATLVLPWLQCGFVIVNGRFITSGANRSRATIDSVQRIGVRCDFTPVGKQHVSARVVCFIAPPHATDRSLLSLHHPILAKHHH